MRRSRSTLGQRRPAARVATVEVQAPRLDVKLEWHRRCCSAGMPGPPVPVALVLTSFDAGGTERQMTQLMRRLDPARFLVHVVCFRREGPWLSEVEAAAHEVVAFPLGSFKSARLLGPMRQFVAWLRRREIAVVHACDRYANIFALPGAALARVPVRIGSRRELRPPDASGAHLVAQRCAYAVAHRIVANSRAAAGRLRDERVPRSKIAIIPNGIDLAEFPAPAERSVRRRVGTVANLRAGKGHDVLLRAAAIVLREMPDARFHVIGDGPLRAVLEQLASELGVSGAIEFLGYCDDVPAALAGCDLYAFPSLTDAFPNGLIEGMAAGLPSVASAADGIVELVEPGANGLLVPPGDPAALAAGLLQLMRHPAEAARLGRGARQTVETRFAYPRMVAAFEALYAAELLVHRPRASDR